MGNATTWDGENWSNVQVDSPFDKAKVFVRTTVPTLDAMRTGDLYIDPTTNKAQYRNGAAWVDLGALSVIADVAGLQTALDAKAPLASPTFTGTVAGITKAMVGLGNVDNTSDVNKPVSTAQQTALDLKANLASPTFTGTVGGITKSMVGLSNVDNTTDLGKPISTATQTALDGKSATGHTHVVANITDLTATAAELNVLDGMTATTTELNYVDGVTSAIQTQINGKAATSHTHAATDVSSGVLATARIPVITQAMLDNSGWQTITTFSNSFTAGSAALRYISIADIVFITGNLYRTTAPTSLTEAFVLPAGFRPSSTFTMDKWATWGYGIQISGTGQVWIQASTARTVSPGYHFGGISFVAEG